MNSTKISIIIPVHNAEKYLDQSIGCLINQTLKDIEIICVDDGSKDNSLQILNNYAQLDSRVKVFHHENSKSALGARKTGVMAAQGEYIMFLDADDYYIEDACEIAYNNIKEKNVDIVHFGLDIINIGNSPEHMVQSIKKDAMPYMGALYGEDVFKGCFVDRKYSVTPVNKIYKTDICKKAYSRVADMHLLFAEDLYAFFIISYFAQSYYGIDEKPLYYYCYGRGISGGRGFTLKKHEQVCQHAYVYKLISDFCDEENGKVPEYGFVIERLKNEWLNDCIGIWKGFLTKEEKPEGLKILYKYWGVKDVVSLLAKRFWNSRTELAGYVNKLEIKPLKDREIKTIALYYYSYAVGGVERVLSLLIPKFIEMGYKVVLLTDKEPTYKDFPLPDGVERYIMFDKDIVDGNNFSKRADSWEDVMKKYNIDMVLYSFWRSHLYLFDVMFLRGMDIPVVVQAHGVFSLAISEMHRNFSEHTKTFALADGMTVLSDVDKIFWETYVDKVYHIPNPVSPDLFNANPAKWENKAVSWIGRVSPEKNPEAPFEIMKRVIPKIPDAKLYLLGDFDDPKWKEKAEEFGIYNNVEFVGFVSDVNKYLEKVSVNLLTSSNEGFGMVILEAQAHSVPTVMFNMPHLELGKAECGTIGVEMYDYDSAANEIVKLLTDKKYWQINSELSKANADKLKYYDYKSAWTDVIKGKTPDKYHNNVTDNFIKTIVNHYDIGINAKYNADRANRNKSLVGKAVSAVKCCKEKGFIYTLKLILKH